MCRPVKLAEFDIDKLSAHELINDTKTPVHIFALSYKQDQYQDKDKRQPLILQTNQMVVTQYGITQIFYHECAGQRNFFKFALDPNQPSCTELRKVLEQMDNYFGDPKNYPNIFGHLWQMIKHRKLEYQPLVKRVVEFDSDNDEDEDEDDRPNPKHDLYDYCKLQFNRKISDGTFATGVFIRENGKTKHLEVNNIDKDLCQHCNSLGSKVRFVITPNKLWLSKNDYFGVKRFGVTLKILQMEIESTFKKRIDYSKEYAFANEDEEELPVKISFDLNEKDKKVCCYDDDIEIDVMDSDEENEIIEKFLVNI